MYNSYFQELKQNYFNYVNKPAILQANIKK